MIHPRAHGYPAHALGMPQMHMELASHHDCAIADCDLKRYCWNTLINLGHLHPGGDPNDCMLCASPTAK